MQYLLPLLSGRLCPKSIICVSCQRFWDSFRTILTKNKSRKNKAKFFSENERTCSVNAHSFAIRKTTNELPVDFLVAKAGPSMGSALIVKEENDKRKLGHSAIVDLDEISRPKLNLPQWESLSWNVLWGQWTTASQYSNRKNLFRRRQRWRPRWTWSFQNIHCVRRSVYWNCKFDRRYLYHSPIANYPGQDWNWKGTNGEKGRGISYGMWKEHREISASTFDGPLLIALSYTYTEEVPCAFLDMMLSSPITQGDGNFWLLPMIVDFCISFACCCLRIDNIIM